MTKSFFYNCKQCNYQTIWQDALKQHMQWQHSLPLKTAKRKVDESVGGPAPKNLKNQKITTSNVIPVVTLQDTSIT